MKFVGLHTQISRNNRKSVLLLIGFPLLILIGVYAIIFFLGIGEANAVSVNESFVRTVPIVFVVVGIWFAIAFFTHSKIVQWAVGSKPLERRENKRVYNLTENLCMSVGMQMPKLFIIESPALNAFASGLNDKTFSVTLTRGIIDSLTDEELEGVIAHELSHIRNRDVRLLIITIVFVGIFGVALDLVSRNLFRNLFRKRNNKDGGGIAVLVIFLIIVILYFFAMLFKFALSRSREYMADAGAVELTRNSQALADALKKVSGNSEVETTNNEVKEMFLDNGKKKDKSFFSGISNLFATHPPIEKRIEILENME